ncbi:MAG: hypothetical protein IK016_00040 [Lachnospiraceae bacterium]|nr:hypothetical protein [Lachnospiraceae bacterium]
MKKILFYRYGNICEPDLIECFARAGLDVTEERTQITKKDTSASETVETVSGLLRAESYLFVFSINFFPAVSETCRIFGLPYVCWTVDCPVMELWSDALRNDCNRVFFFDRVQYETFSPRMPTGCAFHLPLATNPDRWDDVIANAGETGLSAFRQEISFVGSLYSEKNRFRSVRESLRDYTKGYLEAVTQAQSRIYGCSLPEGLLTPDIVREFAEADPALQGPLYADNEQAKRAYIPQERDDYWHEHDCIKSVAAKLTPAEVEAIEAEVAQRVEEVYQYCVTH